jgi:hypothetical protein
MLFYHVGQAALRVAIAKLTLGGMCGGAMLPIVTQPV